MSIVSNIRKLFVRQKDDPCEIVATLLLAAEGDESFRRQVLEVVGAPATQRKALVNSAVIEMTLRGEPQEIRAAFAILGTDEGAKAALKILNSGEKSLATR